MIGHLFRLFAWISLVLSLAIILFWIRSYWTMDFFGRMTFTDRRDGPRATAIGIASGKGGIGFWNCYTQWPPEAKVVDGGPSSLSWLRQRDGNCDGAFWTNWNTHSGAYHRTRWIGSASSLFESTIPFDRPGLRANFEPGAKQIS
jgi:hypothetical protein